MDTTFVDVLERHVAAQPDRLAFRFLLDGTADGATATWTYADLGRRARGVAAELRARGLAGERVLLLYPSGLEFVAAFFGCLYAGAVAVPAYPPDPARLARTLPRLQGIAADARATAVLTTDAIGAMSRALATFAPDLARLDWMVSDTLAEGDGARPANLDGDAVAFLQYTSGSTAAPKGVVVTHANLVHNQRVICEAFDLGPGDDPMSWLPLFHDMGLIGHVLTPVWVGGTGTLMAPQDFLRRPIEWLRTISRFRSTASGGPDFAYALVARKVAPEDVAGLDLSCWKAAYCGAEPVRAPRMRKVAALLAPAGFRPARQIPCYGLAESTLMATSASAGEGARAIAVDLDALARGRLADPLGRATELVSVGRPRQGTVLRIVDPETRVPLRDGEVGEVWLRGESVAGGYWGNPEASAEVFGARTADGEGPWLRTGDLGATRAGELYVTGRAKDVVIVAGRNLWPEDLEAAVEASHPAIRGGCAAVFGVEMDGEERVAVACEVDDGADANAVAEAVRGAIATAADAPVHAVALLAKRALPKTSSGKRQRRATRQGFLDGTLEEVARVVFAEAADAGEAPAPATRPEMEAWLARQVAAVLGRTAEGLDRDATFASLGLDSVRAVELATRLDARLDRPLHASILFNVPSITKLAAWLVEGGPTAAGAAAADPLYPNLATALARLDARNPDAYRFDLAHDVAWDRAGEPGEYVPADLFATFGLDVDALRAEPEAWRLLQIASAMTLCTAFEVVEITITLFIDTRWNALGPTRSVSLFREEEEKHVRLFRRYADVLKARHPDLVVDLGWDPSWGVGFWELFRNPRLFPDERVFHYLFWFFFVAFEEHSIYFADVLARAEGMQPAWLDTHRVHRREELQHVATDHAYALALDLPDAERDAWSEVCVAWLCQHYETFFAFGPARRLVAQRFPHLAPALRTPGFTRSPFLRELLHASAFRRTRLTCPYLRDLQQLDPADWPSDTELASRLPAAWMGGRAAVLPDPVRA